MSCDPPSLNLQVHDHLNGGTVGHIRIALEVVDTGDISVASYKKMIFVLPQSSAGISFYLRGPS